MLDGILTSALLLIIVLDICGATLYFLMSGTSKAKEAKAERPSPTPPFTYTSQLLPVMAGGYVAPSGPPPIPDWVINGDRDAGAIYGVEGVQAMSGGQPQDLAAERTGLSANLTRVFSAMKGKFLGQKLQENAESADLKGDRSRLNRVLDSFREEI